MTGAITYSYGFFEDGVEKRGESSLITESAKSATTPSRDSAEVRASKAERALRELLEHNKGALHPSRGKQDARLIRKICASMGWDETQYMDRMYLRDPKKWGLE